MNPYEQQENERQARGEYDEDLVPVLERSIALAAARQREKLAYAKLQEINALQIRAAEYWEKCCSEMYEIEGLN